jgi:hypothetical protein
MSLLLLLVGIGLFVLGLSINRKNKSILGKGLMVVGMVFWGLSIAAMSS